MSLRFGSEHRIDITQMTLHGMGLGTLEDRPVLVSKTVPGDSVTVRMNRKKYGIKTAKVLSYETRSPLRQQAGCPHFSTCGGCQILDIDYADQLALKNQMMTEGLSRLAPHLNTTVHPVIGCEQTMSYRNKMEYAFGADDSGTIFLGLKKRGHFDQVTPTPSCQLMSTEITAIFQAIESVLNQQASRLSVWDYHEHRGVLRHLVVRHSKSQDRYFLNFIVSDMSAQAQLQSVVDHLIQAVPAIQGVHMSLNDSIGDHTFYTQTEVLFGEAVLVDTLGPLSFEISPHSFFQTNPLQAKILYDQIVRLGDFKGDEVVLDLYCGIGTIGAYLARQVKSVIGIEEVPQAIEDAERNRKFNGIENMSFRTARVKNGLKFETFTPDVVIVDPPRSGMVPKALRRVLELAAETIIYVSCNPASMLEDMSACEAAGYVVASIQPVDMFPNTVHLETVTLLKRVAVK